MKLLVETSSLYMKQYPFWNFPFINLSNRYETSLLIETISTSMWNSPSWNFPSMNLSNLYKLSPYWNYFNFFVKQFPFWNTISSWFSNLYETVSLLKAFQPLCETVSTLKLSGAWISPPIVSPRPSKTTLTLRRQLPYLQPLYRDSMTWNLLHQP